MAETTVWIAPDGTQTTLRVGWAAQGRGMPPVTFDVEEIPQQPGARFRDVQHKTTEITLPVILSATSRAALWTAQRALMHAMDPRRGDGILRVTTVLGDTREIVCRYASGLEMSETAGTDTTRTVQMFKVTFRAFVPYWRDTNDTTTSWAFGAAPSGWFPFNGFPSLSTSEIFSKDTVINYGDVDTWPVWTITGPALPVARNLTTGLSWSLNYPIPDSEIVTIDTRPGYKTVTNLAGVNLWPQLGSTSSLWPLAAGTNTVQVESGGTNAHTVIQLARRHMYLSV